ncbi:hypothetical protein NLX86_19740 [Streptomyces sp. A3M-1-3]|uniref:hypothetical protein n=1 Tax=Streptomyces sp. A3M-1-3 TaxID=2962044 RepID=UPI0020B63E21|nr:hypothetical protein [Streptomyces sp. A3M-1-3]MCP3820250.1 hypothetical protein [Streptomyces sp. A3M-1-3]
MSRRVLPPLRAWSGALLVCALMFCLTGLARPAMAMPSSTPSMEMAAPGAVGGDSSGLMQAEAAGQAAAIAMASGSAEHGAHCPMAEKQCEAPKATFGPDVQPIPALTGLSMGTACSAAALMALPNAPPPALPPPDLHRLCVSRT